MILYDALCFKEPWLELMILGFKGLETRTKLMRKKTGDVVCCSSKQIDEIAWNDPNVGGLLDVAAKERALRGLGKLRALINMGGFRIGVPGADDKIALISIRLPNGRFRFVSVVSNARRINEVPTVRYNDKKKKIVDGASQGFFRIPEPYVVLV